MKIYFSLLFVFLLNIPVIQAENLQKNQTKIIKKHFEVNPDATLEINNKYGNINLQTWDKNEIAFHIEIRVKGKNSDKVKERLDAISIDFSGNSKKVSASTNIKKLGFFSRRNNTEFSIVYTVKLPKTNHIALTNEYGNISIDELSGKSAIVLEYGNLNIEKLNNSTNDFKLKYVSRANIDQINKANISAGYTKVNIDQVENLTFNSNYTDLKINKVKKLNTKMDYGNLDIEKVNQIDIESDYTQIKIGSLTQKLHAVNSYGSLNISELEKTFEKVLIKTKYTNVSLGVKSDVGYKLDADISYGKLQYPKNLEFDKQIEKNTQQIYSGQTKNSSGEISLEMRYGNPTIKLIP